MLWGTTEDRTEQSTDYLNLGGKASQTWGLRRFEIPPPYYIERAMVCMYICVTTPRHKRCPYRPLIRYKIGQMPTVTRGG